MAFKQDEDFLRFLTLGAAGTDRTAQALRSRGHRPIELERYAMANKIWATKVKRLRMPDLLCVDCGLRVEARAKARLEMRMSDSDAIDRAWDAGLRDDDLVAFLRCEFDPTSFTAAPDLPQFFAVSAMRAAADASERGAAKAASEGYETDRQWKASVPSRAGRVITVEGGSVTALLGAGIASERRQTYRRSYAYLAPGETFRAGSVFVAGEVEPPTAASLGCSGGWDYATALRADDVLERFAATKAAGVLGDESCDGLLRSLAVDDDDDRVRLEAMAGLARLDPGYAENLCQIVMDLDSETPGLRMEAVLVMSELPGDLTAHHLERLAGSADLDPELRSAAVWGLGSAGVDEPARALSFIADEDDDFALHAVAAVGPLEDQDAIGRALDLLDGDGRSASSAIELLAMSDPALTVPGLLRVASIDNAGATRACAVLGTLGREAVLGVSNELPASVLSAVEPMWTGYHENWLHRQTIGSADLAFLRRQTLRVHPLAYLSPRCAP